MTECLFPDFLSNPADYEKTEALWRDRWQELIRRLGRDRSWKTPWLNTSFANGTPCRDGNPIFSAICPGHRLGIRVIQVEPSPNVKKLRFWTDTFGEGSKEEVKELVISCVLTERTLPDALELMSRWVTEEANPLERVG